MSQIEIPALTSTRRRTRTYDAPNQNTEAVIAAITELLVPAGTIVPTLLDQEPDGGAWKFMNGQWLEKSGYQRLYAVFKDKTDETETSFKLPDMNGRTMLGASETTSLGAMVGQSQILLSINQMPKHGHAVTDPGHTHVFTGSPHSHNITDPGHAHSADEAGSTPDAATGSDEATAQSGGTSGSATTGIGIDPAIAGGTNEPSQTGIEISEMGGGAPVDITPPALVVNWLVRT